MSLLYPLGLLILIGIPILIIIYIIKNKYTEQIISSTYIWTLSEKFLKRRNPINKLVGLISLILQILAVLFIAIAVAHPVFAVPNSAYEYCFVLDGSGSMNIVQSGKTRLDIGKEKIASVINGAMGGCSYTLVYVGTTTEIVFEKTEDKERALKQLNEIEPSYLDTGMTPALGVAQQYFTQTPSVKTYLVTDKSYVIHNNVDIINVSSNAENYALSEVEYRTSNGAITVTGKATSYESDVKLNIALYFGDSAEAAAAVEVDAAKLEPADFEITADTDGFEYFRVVITNGDALALDNEVIVYSPEIENSYKALIVSDNPLYLYAALSQRASLQTEIMSPKDYGPSVKGYNLYIFDTLDSVEMPRDGAVWILKPSANLSDGGFTVQGEITPATGVKLNYENSSSSVIAMLSKDLVKEDIYVAKYVKCGLRRRFTTFLSYDGNPMLFAGTNSYGNREVVFAFDLHDSNLPVLWDYNPLIGNLLNYTFPNVIDETTFVCGDSVYLNIAANCDSIRVDSPLEKVSYLNTGSETAEIVLTEVGVYTITLTSGNAERKVFLYSALPESERRITAEEESFSLKGIPDEAMKTGTYDDLLAWFIVLAVLVAADWMVYCYEQYQLR